MQKPVVGVSFGTGGGGGGPISFEVFAAKNENGDLMGIMVSVPCRCGLNEADTLRINGSVMLAVRGQSVLPIDFPELSVTSREYLFALARSGQRLAVAEFKTLGLLNAYFLNVQFAVESN